MRVVIIGTGNTASVLGRLMKQSNHELLQVYGRTVSSAQELASQFGSRYCTDPAKIDLSADIYVIAVSDDAIPGVANSLNLQNKLVVHTAGSVSKDVLKQASRNYGVLYPLQSLRKEMKDLPLIPMLVDGNTIEDLTLIYDFALSLTNQVQKANDEERLRYHLAAVMVNNFSNHLYTLVRNYCLQNGTDFNLLLPLVQQLPQRLSEHSPEDLQTGPAIRNDRETINKHLDLLANHPQIRSLYQLFTESIQNHYRDK